MCGCAHQSQPDEMNKDVDAYGRSSRVSRANKISVLSKQEQRGSRSGLGFMFSLTHFNVLFMDAFAANRGTKGLFTAVCSARVSEEVKHSPKASNEKLHFPHKARRVDR